MKKYYDLNKQRRDRECRFLKSNDWIAAHALKRDGSTATKWIWLHPNYRKPCSRIEAVKLTKRGVV